MMDHHAVARNWFGIAAFVIAAAVIGLVLSPFVPSDRDQIANVILGNVLNWPAIVLAYHFGTSAGSVRKMELLEEKEKG